MSVKNNVPEVNAGSMADISFLLLIFFLVTSSIENDEGIYRMLPKDGKRPSVEIKQRNLLEISIGNDNQLMVREEIIPLNKLRSKVVAFLDNGGAKNGNSGFCEYCRGQASDDFSENPDKAIISLVSGSQCEYGFYIAVQNEIVGAYNSLRNREALSLYGTNYQMLIEDYNNETNELLKEGIKEKIQVLRTMYPQKIVEPETIYAKN
ncbi:MAG: ExbD/TolR family protein [Croceivirga sp.]